jgi:hypothetical protein
VDQDHETEDLKRALAAPALEWSGDPAPARGSSTDHSLESELMTASFACSDVFVFVR